MATRFETKSQWLTAHRVPAERLTQSIAGVANRVGEGEDFNLAVRDFLDEFALAGDDDWREQAIAQRPAPTGEPRQDAYLGALAEHLAAAHGLARPPWSTEQNRFLDSFWFVSETPGFRATAIAQAPAAFRRRGIFVPERSLHRI